MSSADLFTGICVLCYLGWQAWADRRDQSARRPCWHPDEHRRISRGEVP